MILTGCSWSERFPSYGCKDEHGIGTKLVALTSSSYMRYIIFEKYVPWIKNTGIHLRLSTYRISHRYFLTY